MPSYRDGSFRGGMSFLGGLNKKKNQKLELLFAVLISLGPH